MRDLRSALVAILIGLLLTILLPARWAGFWLLAVMALPWIVLTGWRALIGWLAVGVMLGLVSQSITLAARPASEPASPVMVTGKVVGLPALSANRQRFLFAATAFDDESLDPGLVPRQIRVSIYGGDLRVRAGEQWQLPLKIRRPRGFMNPLRFDYEAWLAASGIDATAYVTDPEQAERLQIAGGLPRWRAELSDRIARLVGEQGQGSALLQGLMTGDRRGFADQTWEILRLTGTSHLLAISGLHIGLAAGLGFFLGRVAWRYLRLPGERRMTAVVCGALFATGYAALAGFSLPTQRALLMFLLFALASLLARQRLGINALLLAALLLLIVDPGAALGVSFWLSFTAVLLILLAANRLQRANAFWGLCQLQWLLTLGLAPMTALFFGQWSPLGLVINLIMLPLFSFFIVPGALLGLLVAGLWPDLGAYLLKGLSNGLEQLLAGGEYLLALGLQPMPTTALSVLLCLAAIAAITLMLLPRGAPLRMLAGPLLLPLLAGHALAAHQGATLPPGGVKVTWLEVGQGNAAVVETRDQVVVIDTGPAWGGGASAATFTLVPFLQARGIEHIDYLVVTHADRDHRGGVEALVQHFTLGEVWVGESVAALSQQQFCHAGAGWVSDGVGFEFLWPPKPGTKSGNAASCVLLLRAGGYEIVFTGDIDQTIEQQLVRRVDLRPYIVEAPHHGSDTSTSHALLRAWNPAHVVIAAGYRNPYGMPHADVIQRVRCHGADIHDLGRSGALALMITPGHLPRLQRWRERHAKLLHERAQQARFRDGREIHYHQHFIATSPTEAGQPKCGN